VGGDQLLLEQFAAAVGVGPVVLKRQIERQDLEALGLRLGLRLANRRRSLSSPSTRRAATSLGVGQMLHRKKTLHQHAEQAAGKDDAANLRIRRRSTICAGLAVSFQEVVHSVWTVS
jgi:hypothetical protein